MSKASLRRIAIIIKREYLQRVFTRSFAGSTLLIPVLLVGMVAVPAYLIGVRPKPAAPGVLEFLLGSALPTDWWGGKFLVSAHLARRRVWGWIGRAEPFAATGGFCAA